MKIIAAAILLAMLSMGCSHTLALHSKSTSDEFAEANSEVQSGTSFLKTQNGSAMTVRHPVLQPDTVRWQDAATSEPVRVPFSLVKSIENRHHHTRGAFEGFGMGLASGAVLGMLVAVPIMASRGKNDDNGSLVFVASEFIAIPIGFIAGTIYGGLHGSKTTVVVQDSLE